MVFKPINLARTLISKTFPNGYAQSLVAASQSSSASHNTSFNSFSTNVTNYFGKTAAHSSHQNHALPHPARPDGVTVADRGLDAYYAAWQKHHKEEEKELHQFQFAKRIGWKAPTTIPEPNNAAVKPAEELLSEERPVLVRAKSTSALDVKTDKEVLVERAETPITELDSPVSTKATSVSEIDVFVDRLTWLAENQRHAEIPAIFEALLSSGHTPTATAYNALLLAAIHLPRGKHQIVPKVLDVYSDMKQRRVVPNTATYAILIEVLAARAMDVSAMKDDLLRRKARFGGFASDETEFMILEEDDSLSLAIKLFDTSAAVTTNHAFPAETYRLLISACAEDRRIDAMVRIYAEMESQNVLPPTTIFAPMIEAFASAGDLRSAVECYEEYKSMAIAHDQGLKSIQRVDPEVYAAVVKGYSLCGQIDGGMTFYSKLENSLSAPRFQAVKDSIGRQALVPQWIAQGDYQAAIAYAQEMSENDRLAALEAICIDAADNFQMDAANQALSIVQTANAAAAVVAAHARAKNTEAARAVWNQYLRTKDGSDLIEVTTLFAAGASADVLRLARQMFARIREAYPQVEVTDRIEEAIEAIAKSFLPVPDAVTSIEILQTMVENNMASPMIEAFLAPLGPAEISSLPASAIRAIIQIQGNMLIQRPDIAHAARLGHLIELVNVHGLQLESSTAKIVDEALTKIGRTDLVNTWQTRRPYDDTFDPYGASTDFKGSIAIGEELEKSGRFSVHLNEALTKFKNMRRAGRHPRYATYAKLINAAAKENRLSIAHDVLAMARQDVPLIPGSRVVTHGWVAILDAMVGACLTVGQRDAAAQYHQDLLNMGAAPSANTFGLYITTLKESTKTFDEATEAVKIFHRAKTEGVEPTSFLYNALIGKLGKARRIDDCLFYFAEMRGLGIRPTSVTYGTVVNALCRVSDDKFAEELFEEMEGMPNYKPRPAPYNSLMQYFLSTKRDRSKVLAYYNRMLDNKIVPTMHTYKLLIDTYATLEPVDMSAAEAVLDTIRGSGAQPEAVHYASLIHAKGCVQQDLPAAKALFDSITSSSLPPNACLYQAMFESMVANHAVQDTEPLLGRMSAQRVQLTPYIANTLIHGWATANDVNRALAIYDALGIDKREPSTYEAMTRAYLASEDHGNAMAVVGEALRRGYPAAVRGKLCDLVGGGRV